MRMAWDDCFRRCIKTMVLVCLSTACWLLLAPSFMEKREDGCTQLACVPMTVRKRRHPKWMDMSIQPIKLETFAITEVLDGSVSILY